VSAFGLRWREQLPALVHGAPVPDTLAASTVDAVAMLVEVCLWAAVAG
jgi:hypothetical protein